jgi:hypothetical protein
VTMIMIVRMIVTVAVAVVRMAAGFLRFFVHPFDSNRDLVCLTARIRAASEDNNVVDRSAVGNERICRNAIDLPRRTRLPWLSFVNLNSQRGRRRAASQAAR